MDFDDLLGGDSPPRPKRGRPSNEDLKRRAQERLADAMHQQEIKRAAGGDTKIKVDRFFLPVTKNWLAELLHMDVATVTKRLRRCPAVSKGQNGRGEVFYFHQALPYLVKPVMTPDEFVRTLNKADLPPEINNAFWSAQRTRIRYKLEAQEAWETEDIVRLLGEVAGAFKDATNMLAEELRQRLKLSDQQVETVEQIVDGIKNSLAEKLLEIPEKSETPSMFGKPLFGVGGDRDIDPTKGYVEDYDFGDDEE
ncbi:MAG: hypothetical protein AAFW82_03660 [Pseudomonadota bacterium]